MKNLKQKIAVVTGAGSGIGRATALALADEGCLLAISDISEPNLEETRLAIEALGAKSAGQCTGCCQIERLSRTMPVMSLTPSVR